MSEETVYVHPVKRTLALPDSPAVVAGFGHASIFTADGELLTLPTEEAAALLRNLPPPILVHAPATFRRLGMRTCCAIAASLRKHGRRGKTTR